MRTEKTKIDKNLFILKSKKYQVNVVRQPFEGVNDKDNKKRV